MTDTQPVDAPITPVTPTDDGSVSASMMMEREDWGIAAQQSGNIKSKKARRQLSTAASKILRDYWETSHYECPDPQKKTELLQNIHAVGDDWYTRGHLSRWFSTKRKPRDRAFAGGSRDNANTPVSQAGSSSLSVSRARSGSADIQYTPDTIVKLEALLSTNPKPTPDHIRQWSIVLGIDAEAIDIYIQIKNYSLTLPAGASQDPSQLERKPTLEELQASERRQIAHLPTPLHSISPEPVHRRPSPVTPIASGSRVDPHTFLLVAEKALPPAELRNVVDAFVQAGVVDRGKVEHIGRTAHDAQSSSEPEAMDIDHPHAADHWHPEHDQAVLGRCGRGARQSSEPEAMDVDSLHATEHLQPRSQVPGRADHGQAGPPPRQPVYELLREVFASDTHTPPLDAEAIPRTTADFERAFILYATELDAVLEEADSPDHPYPRLFSSAA
ncbi:hypothetical protein OE88DRAFT_1667123 [Heliocybe sulcata]|uniref:Uncharacterized protein n=1 Tax=Heliocybe sulcata TaxID=5364 RepID=A0A5C3MPG3_9AGAM|nr:hypothetical protein OE88DRAFT_1667123 [Heliocybe sulcata]